ncbi:MAG: NmrA/HSCARG family protein [Verrucomicrobia bacterium]|nr:NmrA/HSCARG family protein [Verrucomicrobiota bacterium]
MNKDKLILVTGATGNQGGAVARHLLARGYSVRAFTRNAEKLGAKALAGRGAQVAIGDLDDRTAIERALAGCYGVFSVQNFWETGRDREVRQGKTLADCARAAGVKHFVYTSVAAANSKTGLPHFDSKWEIEEHIRRIGLPHSILRPVFFMQNWWNYMRDSILAGTLALPLSPGRRLQQIHVDDIGAFAALAFENPDRWLGRAFDLAGDEPTMTGVANTLSRVIGRTVKYVQVPWEQFRSQSGEEMTLMYRWFEAVGYKTDIAAVRREYPQLAMLEPVLRSQDWTEATVKKAA